jgi:ribosomal protein L19
MGYFDFFVNNVDDVVLFKEKRKSVLGFLKVNFFMVGDFLSIVFFSKNCPFLFEGLCICIRKKSLLSSNTSFVVQNFVVGVLIQLIVSYYYNRVYNMVFLNYKKDINLVIRCSKIYRLYY